VPNDRMSRDRHRRLSRAPVARVDGRIDAPPSRERLPGRMDVIRLDEAAPARRSEWEPTSLRRLKAHPEFEPIQGEKR
jgi:hypothetical protein